MVTNKLKLKMIYYSLAKKIEFLKQLPKQKSGAWNL